LQFVLPASHGLSSSSNQEPAGRGRYKIVSTRGEREEAPPHRRAVELLNLTKSGGCPAIISGFLDTEACTPWSDNGLPILDCWFKNSRSNTNL